LISALPAHARISATWNSVPMTYPDVSLAYSVEIFNENAQIEHA
jgi:hypothetical protein